METRKTPAIIYAEGTPNPLAMKFVCNRLLIGNGNTVEYKNRTQAKGSPLALALFNFPFVTGVFITGNFVTVLKSDAVSWNDITLELREYIQQYLNDGNEVINELPQQQENENSNVNPLDHGVTHVEPTNETEARIIDLLEEYIRPAVEQDGGAIYFKSYQEGLVTLTLKGSCSGCPSSSMTLKAGIEGLLKRMIPEVQEVVAEAL
ncbi:MAG: NifU family protein [Bacteroidetes bacterium]|nr:NifU family protein [Bacteroidota bacterium]HET6245621.1 NifU family protein [Bacteroidia bacterium]